MIAEHESSTRRPSSSLINRLYIIICRLYIVMHVLCVYMNLAFAIGIKCSVFCMFVILSVLTHCREVTVFHE